MVRQKIHYFIERKLPILLVSFSVIMFLYTIFLMLIGSHDIDIFDGSLKIISKIYASKGYLPYKDFNVVYPPGLFLIFGKFFHYSSEIRSDRYLAFFYILVSVINVLLLARITWVSKKLLLYIAIFLIYTSLMFRIFFLGEAIPLLLIFTSALTFLCFLNFHSKYYLLLGFFVSFASIWFRWEWMLELILLYLFIYLIILVLKKKFVNIRKLKFDEQTHTNIFYFFASSLVGYVISATLMASYFYSIGVLYNAFQFIVVIPLTLTAYYRDLPLPIPKHFLKPEMILYLSFIIYFYLFLVFIKKTRSSKNLQFLNNAGAIFITLLPLVFLPYALGRSSWGHSVPLWFTVGLVWILVDHKFDTFSNLKLMIILLPILTLLGWYIKASYILIPRVNYVQTAINSLTFDCKKLVKTTYARSIFVARKSYDKFLWNNASLYLIRPDLKPASGYITEEPGIHNECKYQNIIVGELKNARKPMIVTLEEQSQEPENEATKKMKSCGVLENYLSSSNYDSLGYCRSDAKDYEVRLYK